MTEKLEAETVPAPPKKKFVLNPKIKNALLISLTAGATAFVILGGQNQLSKRDEDVEAKTLEAVEAAA